MKKRLESSVYHSVLRVALVVVALVLLFDSGIVSESTATLSRGAQNYVAAAVGVRVGVAPNEVNVLTARITELEGELARKDREIAVNLNTGDASTGPSTSTFILSIILFILLILIILNYILDYVRIRRETTPRPVRIS
jgi:hypothetical protein